VSHVSNALSATHLQTHQLLHLVPPCSSSAPITVEASALLDRDGGYGAVEFSDSW
jgi:hypothetical protein